MRKLLALFFFSMLAMTAMATPAAANASSKTAAAAQSHVSVSDAQLEAMIRTKLTKSKIGKDGFRFKVQRGIVTWEGTTAIGQHKGAATRMARTSGAVQVINNIRVSNVGKETPLRKAYVQPLKGPPGER